MVVEEGQTVLAVLLVVLVAVAAAVLLVVTGLPIKVLVEERAATYRVAAVVVLLRLAQTHLEILQEMVETEFRQAFLGHPLLVVVAEGVVAMLTLVMVELAEMVVEVMVAPMGLQPQTMAPQILVAAEVALEAVLV